MPQHVALTRPIDLTAPGAIEQLLAFHRQTFGDARMEEGAGGDGNGAPPAGDGQPPAGQQPAPTPPAGDQPPAPAPPATEWDGKVESLPEGAQKMIRDLRAESAERRTKLTATEQAQQDAIRALAKAAGIELPGSDGDGTPDPAQLAEQLASEQTTTKNLQREHQVLLSAITAGADHKRLLDSRSFLAKVADLDPAAEDFPTSVDSAIKQALTDDPTLKAGRVPGTSSVDHPGGSGEGPAKPTTLGDAIAQKMAATP